jgi:hypothetical protein
MASLLYHSPYNYLPTIVIAILVTLKSDSEKVKENLSQILLWERKKVATIAILIVGRLITTERAFKKRRKELIPNVIYFCILGVSIIFSLAIAIDWEVMGSWGMDRGHWKPSEAKLKISEMKISSVEIWFLNDHSFGSLFKKGMLDIFNIISWYVYLYYKCLAYFLKNSVLLHLTEKFDLVGHW